jgi:hypothetical protein
MVADIALAAGGVLLIIAAWCTVPATAASGAG